MIDEADVVNGYKWILGRIPAPEEVAAACHYYNYLDTGQIRAFQSGLLISEEFRNRRIAAQQHMRVDPVDLFRPKLIFCHIEKCGGTTMRTMLMSQFEPHRVCPERFNGLADWTANELAAYDLFAGHFDLACCDVIPGRQTATITMLREPKARLLSLFQFWKMHPAQSASDNRTLVGLARNSTAHEFFSHPSVVRHPSIRDAITGQLTRTTGTSVIIDGFPVLPGDDPLIATPKECLEAALSNLSTLTSFGIVEHYELSRRLINHQLDLQMPRIEPQQVSRNLVTCAADVTGLCRIHVDRSLDVLLEALTPIDQALFSRATDLFQENLALLE